MSENQTKISLSQLSEADRKALMSELAEKQKQEQEQRQQERANYKQEVHDTVTIAYPELLKASDALAAVKKLVFELFKDLTAKKAELYNREDDQNTHSFSTTDGNISITIGFNLTDGWDDTVNTGITKVNDYLQSLVTDDNKALVETVMKLLSKDGKGNLKASRVLQLKQLADKSGNKNFIEAIQIIQDAHRPVRSKEFIRCEVRNANGDKEILPLSIVDVKVSTAEALVNTEG